MCIVFLLISSRLLSALVFIIPHSSFLRPLRQCLGRHFDVPRKTGVEIVVKVHCGTVLGTHFQHGGKVVPQNSPTMHFDNHLDPVFRATLKWRMQETVE